MGKSFLADGREYFVGDCEHGTQIARYICQVCLVAELYIARLDDSRCRENQKFTIASCYQALQRAIKRGVDIIPMSWTFMRKGSEKDEYEREFVSLVKNAGNIILFGALPDKGPTLQNMRFAPVGLNNVIRIASATTYGETSKDNLHDAINFLLPGEKMDIQPEGIVSGSSYVTVYTTGLADIVFYCIKANQEPDENDSDVDLVAMTSNKQGMSNIFCHFGGKAPENKTTKGIFLMPCRTFKTK